jgi:RNA polymerase sigma-70 factor (ECF subfamily)
MDSSASRMQRTQALWGAHAPAIARALLCYERDADLRQDLTQDVFLAMLASLERIEAADRPKAYLLRIVHNVATDHVAKEARHRWVALPESIVAPGRDPAERANAAHERERLIDAVRQLSLPYRQVVALALEGLDHAEIAESLGISQGTVRVRYFRAKDRLKELLGDA